MRPSEVLLRAAEFSANQEDPCHYACNILQYDVGATTEEIRSAMEYFILLKPNDTSSAWWNYQPILEADFLEPAEANELFRQYRVIGLLLAAAIAESEGN